MLDTLSTLSAPATATPIVPDVDRNLKPAGAAPTFEVPPEDEAFFHTRLPLSVQADVLRQLKLARALHNAGNLTASARRIAAQISRQEGRKRGFSWQSLLRKYREYTSGVLRSNGECFDPGDWRVFWDKAKFQDAARRATDGGGSIHHYDFKQFILALAENNQRNFGRAYAELLHIWRTRHTLNETEVNGKLFRAGAPLPSLPGYAEWPPEDPATGRPAGWSERNVRRIVEDLDDFAKSAARVGLAAASTHRLKVHTTRVHLCLGQFYEFDDHEFNVKIVLPHQRVFLRPRGFFGIDVLSACCFARGFKPTLWDAELEKKEALTEEDFRWFLVGVLTTHGYRADDIGTAFILERGTAAVRDEFEARIHDATGGKVRIERGGKFNRPAHAGQLPSANPGRGKGNFRFKALIEGFFNLVDNAFASMPGQVGLNRDRCPEQLAMIEQECRHLLDAAALLPPSAGGAPASLQFPLLTWEQFFWRAQQLFDALDARTDHNLEGWERLGFITAPVVAADQIITPARRMAPREVWDAQREQLQRLRRWKLPALLGPENCYRASGEDTVGVREGVIEIDHRAWTQASDPVRFLAVDYHGARLKNGERFRAYLNPFDTSVLVLCDAKERVVAECPRIESACRSDVEAIKRLQGKAAHWQAQALEEMNQRHAGRARDIAERREQNGNVIAGRPLSEEPKRLREEEELAAMARAIRMEEAENPTEV